MKIAVVDANGRVTGVEEVARIEKSEAEWRASLPGQVYDVARGSGTERAFTGEYWDCHEDGLYRCACCGTALFDSRTKFESGTGWPSFWAPVAEENVGTHRDLSLGMARIESLCARCGAHLGHRFPDGPAPTGQRYCMNSAALCFEPRGAETETARSGGERADPR